MIVLNVRNVNGGFLQGLRTVESDMIEKPSRFGNTYEATCPVTTVYEKPTERVLFNEERDANPFFHLFEALWMMAGRCDVKWLSQFNRRMVTFSDDGETLPASYGHRWFNYFQVDQIGIAIELLKRNKDDRRIVVQMWDAKDLFRHYITTIRNEPVPKDVPCNTQIYFKVRAGMLDMTVCNRSNDIIWGTFGANAVHMSILHEYVAAFSGIPIGQYYQISDSFHVYCDVYHKLMEKIENLPSYGCKDLYETKQENPQVLVTDSEDIHGWHDELRIFLSDDYTTHVYKHDFFSCVAEPMRRAWDLHKAREYESARNFVKEIESWDWRLASRNWIHKRQEMWEARQSVQ